MNSRVPNGHQKVFLILERVGIVLGCAPWLYSESLPLFKRILARSIGVFLVLLHSAIYMREIYVSSSLSDISQGLNILRNGICYSTTLVTFYLLKRIEEWTIFQNDLNEISASFFTYPESTNFFNSALMKPAIGLVLALMYLIEHRKSIAAPENVLQLWDHCYTYYIIFLIFHILETYNWKYKELIVVMKQLRNPRTPNMDLRFFEMQMGYSKIIKRSNKNFNEICGAFFLILMNTAFFNIFYLLIFTDEWRRFLTIFTSYLIGSLVLVMECDEVVHSYETLLQQNNFNLQYQLFHSRNLDLKKVDALKKVVKVLKANKIEFSCNGFVNIDRGLVIKVIDALATFAAIKMQLAK